MDFPANGTFDCRVLDTVVIGRMISSTRSASDLGAGSGTMLGVDGLADSADLERGYHLRCRSKGMVAHHDAACTNVLGRILIDVEAAIRCQVFSKNVGKVVEVKPKRESLENHALLSLLNGVLHLLCNSTSNEYVSRTLCKSLEDMYLVSISNLVTSNISH